MDALIGSTGFVGGNLRRTRDFSRLYSSANIAESAGQRFDTVVCAAAPGSMVEANRTPERDAARIDAITGHLSRLEARQVVLVSSIAVLAGFGHGQDEGTAAFEEDTAYGRNRRRLEAFCAAQFERCLILRLPALFGHGLRKNMLFDLMNPVPSMLTDDRRNALAQALAPALVERLMSFYSFNPETTMWHLDRDSLDAGPDRKALGAAVEAAGFEALRFTNPASRFQFFDLSLLSGVIDTALAAGLSVLHVAPQPLDAQSVVTALRGSPMQASGARVHLEDMRTRHAALFGRTDGYIADEGQVLGQLRGFIASQS
jgi:hypothetical protein